MPGRKFLSGSKYRYGFQNQEEDPELWGGAVSYKYRIEDPRLGRFFSVDPLTDEFPWNSPFAFSENRVVDGIELEGLEVILVDKVNDPVIYNAALKTKDSDDLINLYAHGNPSLIENGKTAVIKDAKSFDKMLKEKSKEYNAARKAGKPVTIIMHSCRTGRTTFDKKGKPQPSLAQKLSTIPGVTVIAPDERDMFSLKEKGKYEGAYEVGARVGDNTDENGNWKSPDKKTHTYTNGRFGNWNTFKDGKLIDQNKTIEDAKENINNPDAKATDKPIINSSSN